MPEPTTDPRVIPRQGPAGPSDRWFGLPKWAVILIGVAGLLLAWYLWKNKDNKSSLGSVPAGTEPDTTNGVTAADIGGTPADNSFATNTDLTAIEQQIQQLQNSLFQLQQSNGGNGAGINLGDPGGVSRTITPGTAGDTLPVVGPTDIRPPIGGVIDAGAGDGLGYIGPQYIAPGANTFTQPIYNREPITSSVGTGRPTGGDTTPIVRPV